MQVTDPVGGGLVESLARPGGNATGFTNFEYSLSAKWLELLKEIAPNVTRVAVIRDPTRGPGIGQFAVIQSVGPSLGVELRPINALNRVEIESAIEAFARSSNGGLIVTSGGTGQNRDLIVPAAARHRLPAVYPFKYYVTDGGLISYGPNTIDLYRRAAAYIDRILKGEKPADKAIAVRCDVSDDAQVAAIVDRTVAEFGRLDAAFNNAGVMARIAPTADSTREDWDRVIGVNLRGVWSCMKHELRQMERQGRGAIVNNASVGALTGNPGIASYIASKHGVVGLTRTAALEYVKRGIRVNAVNPGLIDTQIARDVVNGDEHAYAELAKHVPIGRAGRPEEIASVVLWLCSPGASYVVGHALTVDGGMTVV